MSPCILRFGKTALVVTKCVPVKALSHPHFQIRWHVRQELIICKSISVEQCVAGGLCLLFFLFFPSVLDVSLNSRCNHWQLSSHWSLRICDTSNTHAKQTLMVPSLRVTATVHVCLCFSLLSPVEIQQVLSDNVVLGFSNTGSMKSQSSTISFRL